MSTYSILLSIIIHILTIHTYEAKDYSSQHFHEKKYFKTNRITSKKDSVFLDIPARQMWGWGGDVTGYCGETCFQMAGLYFGNWISSELIRYANQNKQLLLGINDITTAKILKYTYDIYNGQKIEDFIAWVKNHIDQGSPVLLGFYQYHTLHEDVDDDYDHIMPIIGYSLDTNKQVNGFYFYDLYCKNYRVIKAANFKDFKKKYFKTRKETHKLKSYKLSSTNQALINENNQIVPNLKLEKDNTLEYEISSYTYAIPKNVQYSIAITGIEHKKKEKFLRTKLMVNDWHEPDWGAENKKNEEPTNLQFSAIVYDLTPGKHYSILIFQPEIDRINRTINTKNIPKNDYLEAKYTQKISFTAQNLVEKINIGPLRSDGAYFFRTIEEAI